MVLIYHNKLSVKGNNTDLNFFYKINKLNKNNILFQQIYKDNIIRKETILIEENKHYYYFDTLFDFPHYWLKDQHKKYPELIFLLEFNENNIHLRLKTKMDIINYKLNNLYNYNLSFLKCRLKTNYFYLYL